MKNVTEPAGWMVEISGADKFFYSEKSAANARKRYERDMDAEPGEPPYPLYRGATAQPQPSAHLTIPGALEWDGDNGTHGVVGTHGADGESRDHGESSELERLKEKLEAIRARPNSIDHSADAKIPNALDAWGRPVPQYLPYDFSGNPGASATQYCNGWNDSGSYWKNHVIDIEAQLANAEQSRRSFFDLSQDLEKKLAERDALLNSLLTSYRDIAREPTPGWVCAGTVVRDIRRGIESLSIIAKPVAPKTCIECDQPYCHGVCVERGDQDYDRDQAARGGEQ